MKRTGLVGLVLLTSAARADAPTPPLLLDAVVSDIRQRNPSAAAASRRIEAARIAIPRARALPDPFLQGMVEDIWRSFQLRRQFRTFAAEVSNR